MKGVFVGRGEMHMWTKGMGVGCPACWRELDPGWRAEQEHGQAGNRLESSLAGEISDCSLVLHFIHKVHPCSVCCVVI